MPRPTAGREFNSLIEALCAWTGYHGYDEGVSRTYALLGEAERSGQRATKFMVVPSNKYVAVYFDELRDAAGFLLGWGYVSISATAMRHPVGPHLRDWADAQGWVTDPESSGGWTVWHGRGRRRAA